MSTFTLTLPPYIDRYIQDAAFDVMAQIEGFSPEVPYLSIDRPLPATGCKARVLADHEVKD
jgi:hypothetical protein